MKTMPETTINSTMPVGLIAACVQEQEREAAEAKKRAWLEEARLQQAEARRERADDQGVKALPEGRAEAAEEAQERRMAWEWQQQGERKEPTVSFLLPFRPVLLPFSPAERPFAAAHVNGRDVRTAAGRAKDSTFSNGTSCVTILTPVRSSNCARWLQGQGAALRSDADVEAELVFGAEGGPLSEDQACFASSRKDLLRGGSRKRLSRGLSRSFSPRDPAANVSHPTAPALCSEYYAARGCGAAAGRCQC
jgi:hypothetical protein